MRSGMASKSLYGTNVRGILFSKANVEVGSTYTSNLPSAICERV